MELNVVNRDFLFVLDFFFPLQSIYLEHIQRETCVFSLTSPFIENGTLTSLVELILIYLLSVHELRSSQQCAGIEPIDSTTSSTS